MTIPKPRIDPYGRLNDIFSPENGGDQIIARSVGDLSELRESMRENGWIDDPAFYAVQDEHGVLLMGHRRMVVAAELGIEPRIRTVKCGVGDAADIKRFQLAMVSNIGHKRMTVTERRQIVAVLAGPEHDWTQKSIAEALGVKYRTIAADVEHLRQLDPDLTAHSSRHQRIGWPKGKRRRRKFQDPYVLEKVRECEIRYRATGEPIDSELLSMELGLGEPSLELAQAYVQGALDAEEGVVCSQCQGHLT